MATQAEITEVLLLMRFLPNSPLASGDVASVVKTFAAVLEDIPGEAVKAAGVQILSNATFFPTPGDLRNRAMDLQLLAMGIPTPAEAWAQVQHAEKYVQGESCGEGEKLRTAYIEKQTREGLRAYSIHRDTCTFCTDGGFKELYDSPAVAEVVRLLGGRDSLMTDNPAADRARFVEAYRDIISRERTLASMTPVVSAFVEGEKVKQLADKLSMPRLKG